MKAASTPLPGSLRFHLDFLPPLFSLSYVAKKNRSKRILVKASGGITFVRDRSFPLTPPPTRVPTLFCLIETFVLAFSLHRTLTCPHDQQLLTHWVIEQGAAGTISHFISQPSGTFVKRILLNRIVVENEMFLSICWPDLVMDGPMSWNWFCRIGLVYLIWRESSGLRYEIHKFGLPNLVTIFKYWSGPRI